MMLYCHAVNLCLIIQIRPLVVTSQEMRRKRWCRMWKSKWNFSDFSLLYPCLIYCQEFTALRPSCRLLSVIWKRSMNPLLYNETLYKLTKLCKDEQRTRTFISDFITKEWLAKKSHVVSSKKFSFMQSLADVSANGRNYSQTEVNDHVGTMLVAVSEKHSTSFLRCNLTNKFSTPLR